MSNALSVRSIHDRMNGVELDELQAKLAALGVKEPFQGEDTVEALFGDIDDGVLDEFVDRLSRIKMNADIFLPVRFDQSVEVRGTRCASRTRCYERWRFCAGSLASTKTKRAEPTSR